MDLQAIFTGFGIAVTRQHCSRTKLGVPGGKSSSNTRISRRTLHTATDEIVFQKATGGISIKQGHASLLPNEPSETRARTQETNPMPYPLITRDNDILGGIPVVTGTRVPVKTLFDYLKANYPLDEFPDDFPTVSREQAQQMIEAAGRQFVELSREIVYEPAA